MKMYAKTEHNHTAVSFTVAMYSWYIAITLLWVSTVDILCQIASSSLAYNYFRSYSILQFGIKSVGIYSRRL